MLIGKARTDKAKGFDWPAWISVPFHMALSSSLHRHIFGVASRLGFLGTAGVLMISYGFLWFELAAALQLNGKDTDTGFVVALALAGCLAILSVIHIPVRGVAVFLVVPCTYPAIFHHFLRGRRTLDVHIRKTIPSPDQLKKFLIEACRIGHQFGVSRIEMVSPLLVKGDRSTLGMKWIERFLVRSHGPGIQVEVAEPRRFGAMNSVLFRLTKLLHRYDRSGKHLGHVPWFGIKAAVIVIQLNDQKKTPLARGMEGVARQ